MRPIIAFFVISVTSLFADEPADIPIKEGESYYFSMTAEHLQRPESKFKVIRILRHPWVEVEMTWTTLEELGGGKFERKKQSDKFYLNMNEVVTIRRLNIALTPNKR